MKVLFAILFFIGISSVAYSQSKLSIPDSVAFKPKPISLYLNQQPKGFFQNQERVLHSVIFPFNSFDYNFSIKKGNYTTPSYNVLNPYRTVDPFEAVLTGTLNYLLAR